MGLLNKFLTAAEEEKKILIEYFNAIAGLRIPKGDYSSLFTKISIREAKNIKLALDSYPDLILSGITKKDLDAGLEAEKIKQYRNNRPDYKPPKPKRDSAFVAGFKAGAGIGGSGDSNH
jgi:hypothetical protein